MVHRPLDGYDVFIFFAYIAHSTRSWTSSKTAKIRDFRDFFKFSIQMIIMQRHLKIHYIAWRFIHYFTYTKNILVMTTVSLLRTRPIAKSCVPYKLQTLCLWTKKILENLNILEICNVLLKILLNFDFYMPFYVQNVQKPEKKT